MIQFDTNFLVAIVASRPGSLALSHSWLNDQRTFSISAMAWSEFCNGPLNESSKEVALQIIEDRILDFSRSQTELSALLFNETGRRRASRADCMVAATAISHQASLATYIRKGFEKFIPHGLQLEDLSTN